MRALQLDEDKAEKRRDYRAAELAYDKMIAGGMHERQVDERRYLLFLKEGKKREAYFALKDAVTDTPKSLSSDAQDPVMLVAYAKLSEEYGGPSESAATYRLAIQVAPFYLYPGLDPRNVSASELKGLSAVAHYLAGFSLAFSLKFSEALPLFRVAAQNNSHSGLAHFGLGYTMRELGYQKSDKHMIVAGIAEIRKAEQLSKGATKLDIQKVERNFGISDGGGATIAVMDKNGNLHISRGAPPHH